MGKIRRILQCVRGGWLFLGYMLLIFVLIEIGLSIAFLARDKFTTDHRFQADAYADNTWPEAYFKEFVESSCVKWKPYVYWRHSPYNGQYVNIDTEGIRRTVNATSKTHPDQKIFVFGGSTLWGTGARDQFTIPSILSRELSNRGINASVTNFGETGDVTTQEIIELLLQLQRNDIPDIVIFYDGVNDVFSSYQQRIAGIPQNEYNRVTEFNMTRSGNKCWGVFSSLSIVRFCKGLGHKLGLQPELKIKPLAIPCLQNNRPCSNEQELIKRTINIYENNMKLTKALAESFGFRCFFYWQPTIFQKNSLTKCEKTEHDKQSHMKPFYEQAYELVDKKTSHWKQNYAFHNISDMFSDVQDPVYIDWCHLSEQGNRIVAERLAEDIFSEIKSESK